MPAAPQDRNPKIRLVLADVDGTLVTQQKVLTERAKGAVAQLCDAGMAFAITSGRPPRGMSMLIDELAISEPIAGFNGGVVVRPDMTVIEQNLLPEDAAKQVLDMIAEHKLDAWLYTGDDWFVHDPKAPHVDREQWTVKFPPTVKADFTDLLNQAVKIVGVSDDLDLVARCEKDVQAALGQRVSAARSQPYYLDVTHPKANKGEVVGMLARYLKIPPEEIATIGDMPNDVLMFRKSGVSIAMGNASKEVQDAATFTTASNEDEGFAKAMERLISENK